MMKRPNTYPPSAWPINPQPSFEPSLLESGWRLKPGNRWTCNQAVKDNRGKLWQNPTITNQQNVKLTIKAPQVLQEIGTWGRSGTKLCLRWRPGSSDAGHRCHPPCAWPDSLRRQFMGQPWRPFIRFPAIPTRLYHRILENDVVFGGEKKLYKAILELAERYRGRQRRSSSMQPV